MSKVIYQQSSYCHSPSVPFRRSSLLLQLCLSSTCKLIFHLRFQLLKPLSAFYQVFLHFTRVSIPTTFFFTIILPSAFSLSYVHHSLLFFFCIPMGSLCVFCNPISSECTHNSSPSALPDITTLVISAPRYLLIWFCFFTYIGSSEGQVLLFLEYFICGYYASFFYVRDRHL